MTLRAPYLFTPSTSTMTRTQARWLSFYTWLGVLAVGWAALTLGCFDPGKPACAFSCLSEPHACPRQYTCGSDGLCHRDGSDEALCRIAPAVDGGADASDGEDAASLQF